jgi:hypothetical protein
MFGGAGTYADGVMFGLIVDDVIYLKADADTFAAPPSSERLDLIMETAGEGRGQGLPSADPSTGWERARGWDLARRVPILLMQPAGGILAALF